MENFDKKNGEGYSDPTPYQAIKNMVKPGEIWTFQKKDYTEAEVLVVGFGDNIATILYLMDEYKEGCIECFSKSQKWVNPRMLNWTWAGYLNKCVRKLDDREFKWITAQVEKVLSVKVGNEADAVENTAFTPDRAAEIVAMKHELDAMRIREKEAETVAENHAKAHRLAEKESEKLRIQLALMKEMYADLMDKFLQGA